LVPLQKDFVSSVSSIKYDGIGKPTCRLGRCKALQGRATGVELPSNNGTPGTGPLPFVLGVSALLNGNNDPLYVIDGFNCRYPVLILITIMSMNIASFEILKVLRSSQFTELVAALWW